MSPAWQHADVRRVLVIEALDNGFVVRATGDCGAMARTCEQAKCVRRMLDWFLLAPASPDGKQTGTFPMLDALKEALPVPALEKKDDEPTDATVRQGPVRRPDRPLNTPDPPEMPTTRIMRPRWRRPKT